ncbi:hypothetical protein Taro_054652, partial [Colocasia esculenta]|nr:hypothetical protein [Colocasia esculenta]
MCKTRLPGVPFGVLDDSCCFGDARHDSHLCRGASMGHVPVTVWRFVATVFCRVALSRSSDACQGGSLHGGHSLAVPRFYGRRWSGLVQTSAFSGSRFGVLLASQFRSRVPVRGGTDMCGLPTSWRVQGPEWFCVWALDPVEVCQYDLSGCRGARRGRVLVAVGGPVTLRSVTRRGGPSRSGCRALKAQAGYP